MAYRREQVARLRLRGATLRQIAVELLPKLGIVNPQTKEPYSEVTIWKDIQALEKEWRAEAVKSRASHKAAALAEIREARKKAWVDGDLRIVKDFLKMEIDLLGLDEPIQLQVDWRQELEAVGLSASDEFEQLVNELQNEFEHALPTGA